MIKFSKKLLQVFTLLLIQLCTPAFAGGIWDPNSIIFNLTETFPESMPRALAEPGYTGEYPVMAFHRNSNPSATMGSAAQAEKYFSNYFCQNANQRYRTILLNSCNSAPSSMGTYFSKVFEASSDNVTALQGMVRAVPVKNGNGGRLMALTAVIEINDQGFVLAPNPYCSVNASGDMLPPLVHPSEVSSIFNAGLIQDADTGLWFYETADGKRIEANMAYVSRILGPTLHGQPLTIPETPYDVMSPNHVLNETDSLLQQQLINRSLANDPKLSDAAKNCGCFDDLKKTPRTPNMLGKILKILNTIR